MVDKTTGEREYAPSYTARNRRVSLDRTHDYHSTGVMAFAEGWATIEKHRKAPWLVAGN